MDEFHDLAIIGAGVSGLYTAWRVLEDSAANAHALKLTVFESGDRVGGRLLSVKPPFIHDTYVELGGMRFSEAHQLTHDLTVALGLQSSQLADANPDNVAYLRGHRLRKGDLTDADRIPYVIDESLRNPQSLQNLLAVAAVRALGPAFKQVLDFDLTLETLKDVSVAQWRAVGERGLFEGKPLYETPLHYSLERTLGHGAVQLLQDSLGYDSILWTWSAADGFPWNLADFAGEVPHRHLTEGFAALPMRLADRVVARGAEVRLQTTLKSVDGHVLPDGTAGVRFTTCDHAGVKTTHLARKLVLAMPRRAIELLDQKGALFEEPAAGFAALLKSVSPIPLFKIALCYETCWWERVVGPGSHGKSVTDLPMRQVYYWKVNPEDSQGVVLIYDGGLLKSYWEQLDHAEGSHRPAQVAARRTGVPLWSDFAAPSRVIFEAHRQLLELHGLASNDVPAPYSAACMSWSRDPYGGGSHFWNMGVRSHEVAEKILHPVEPLPVFICGECWSHDQGWVEGALKTAETMLQRYFGLPCVRDTGLI